MAKCSRCGAFIVSGGIKHGTDCYCSPGCVSRAATALLGGSLPEEQVDALVAEIRDGRCPRCRGEGPVDVHTSHSVMSFLIVTRWKSKPKICCRRCGVRAKLGDLAISAIAGWWGFPWGLIMTPVQIGRNLGD